MAGKDYFIDDRARTMIPYEGWYMINDDGTKERDPLLKESEGPFQIITDTVSHGKWHALYNLLDKNGHKLLPKGIRKITYYPEGFYLLDDNNEDALINQGDVKGGFSAKDYVRKMNVMREDGSLLDEIWFEEVIPALGYFRVRYPDRFGWIWIKLSGTIFQRDTIKFGCVIVSSNGEYAIHHSFGERLTDYYTSVMWSDKGIWNVNLMSYGARKTYLFGQGNEIIDYAQAVLLRSDVIALLEVDSIWYVFDTSKKLTPCFRWKPQI